MVAFEVNLSQLEKSIINIGKLIDKFNEDLSHLNNNLKNIDACWKDDNTSAFISHVDSDNYKIYIQLLSLQQTVAISSDFLEQIRQYIKTNLSINKTDSIKYNSSNMDNAIDNLTKAYNELYAGLEKLKLVNFNSSFVYYNKFITTRNNISSAISTLKDLISLVKKINSGMQSIYQTMQDKAIKANPYSIGNKDILFYKYRVETPDL